MIPVVFVVGKEEEDEYELVVVMDCGDKPVMVGDVEYGHCAPGQGERMSD